MCHLKRLSGMKPVCGIKKVGDHWVKVSVLKGSECAVIERFEHNTIHWNENEFNSV